MYATRWSTFERLSRLMVVSCLQVRGHAKEYDMWEQQLGADGWSWKDVLPFFKKSEGIHLHTTFAFVFVVFCLIAHGVLFWQTLVIPRCATRLSTARMVR